MVDVVFGQIAERRMVASRSHFPWIVEIRSQPSGIIGRLTRSDVSEVGADSLYSRYQRAVGERDDSQVAIGNDRTNLLGVTSCAPLCQVDVSPIHGGTRELYRRDGVERLRVFARSGSDDDGNEHDREHGER